MSNIICSKFFAAFGYVSCLSSLFSPCVHFITSILLLGVTFQSRLAGLLHMYRELYFSFSGIVGCHLSWGPYCTKSTQTEATAVAWQQCCPSIVVRVMVILGQCTSTFRIMLDIYMVRCRPLLLATTLGTRSSSCTAKCIRHVASQSYK